MVCLPAICLESEDRFLTFLPSILLQANESFIFSTLIIDMSSTLSIYDRLDYVCHHLGIWVDILYNIGLLMKLCSLIK